MDQIFDRLGNLLKSFISEDSDSRSDEKGTSFSDPDLQDAWDELDEFLRTGKDASQGPASAGGATIGKTPRELERDYRILEVPTGTPLTEVAKSYKQLLRKHHPDRHASDPAEFAKATEKTKLLTSSFRRIKEYEETGKIG